MPDSSHSIADPFLIARVQSVATGADTHELHALLGRYIALGDLAAQEEPARERFKRIETKLRIRLHERLSTRFYHEPGGLAAPA